MKLSPEMLALLRARAAAHGIDVGLDVLERGAVVSVRAHRARGAAYARVGATRFGGDPDLPADFSWPTRTSGPFVGSAAFIAQIALAEQPLRAPGLPATGVLSLFVQGTESAALPVDVHAFHFAAETPLVRRRRPKELADDELAGLRAVPVRWELGVDLAGVLTRWLDATNVEPKDPRWNGVFALASDLGSDLGRSLGTALEHGGDDLRLSAVLAREGKALVERIAMFETRDRLEATVTTTAPWRRNQIRALGADVDWWFEHRDRLLGEMERWHVVLWLESNAAMRLQINDADPLIVLGHEDDLAAGRLDRLVGRVLQG